MLIPPRFSRRQAVRRITMIGGLVLASGLLAGAVTAVGAPAALGATASAHKVNPHTVNVNKAPLSYLRQQAAHHYMGYSLHRHRATSVKASAVPRLKMSANARPETVVYGLDVSSYQGDVNWTANKDAGAHFAYIKATEGNYYKNPYFAQQYDGSYNVGMIRGAYAFAVPNRSGGANQANYLADHGGAWSPDGKTLPAALDIEYNPYSGGECYGLSQSKMRGWINAFLNQYHKRTGRWAVIYSTFDWWNTCTADWGGPHTKDPFWIACYCSSAGTLPSGYGFYTFWQFADSGSFAGDQDVFNGGQTQLVNLAKNT